MPMDPKTKTRMRKMLIFMGVLFGCIFAYKIFGIIMMKIYFSSHHEPVATVSTIRAESTLWQPQLRASGSLRAIQGVDVTTELAGLLETIYFKPGSSVKQGTVLVQLRALSDTALLHSLQANAELAKVTYLRDKAQYRVKAVSKQTLDTDAANLKSLRAQVDQQAAIVDKKTIRAPFSGRLGVSLVNLGQYVTAGQAIVNLQTLDPIWADFYLPQQALAHIKVGQDVTVKTDTYPGKQFRGKITTINPAVDNATRNVLVEATVENPREELSPGMFASMTVDVSGPERFLTLPQTAISFNPYGELVYIVSEKGQDKNGKPILIATQSFVTTGESRGDQISVLKGLKEGDIVVTSGQIKLKNGSQVTINNSVKQPYSANTDTPDEH